MSKVILNHVKKRDADGAEVEFTVGNYKVTAIFPAERNPQIYHHIKRILSDVYTEGVLKGTVPKIGQYL